MPSCSNICGMNGIMMIDMGDGCHFYGEVAVSRIDMNTEMLDATSFDSSECRMFAPGFTSIDISARVLGTSTFSNEPPKMAEDMSVLELLRLANKKMKEREDGA